MTAVRLHLSRLGLAQYAQQFIDEGFESWETVLDITESDLDRLNVKLGHRRVLQREIARERGTTVEELSGVSASSRYSHRDDASIHSQDAGHYVESHHDYGPGPKPKRKYRRHPKADENAPVRPPSAYVLFSNQVRDELGPTIKDFTLMAKLVGERWQALDGEEKSAIESKASVLKKEYNEKFAVYKTTDDYRRYQEYLVDFKEEQAHRTGESGGHRGQVPVERRPESKRPRLAAQGSPESVGPHIDFRHNPHGSAYDQRAEYMGAIAGHGPESALPSPSYTPVGHIRGGPYAHGPLSSHSPSVMSPSSPGMHRESSGGFKTPSLLQSRSGESSVDSGPPSVVTQRHARESVYARSESPGNAPDARASPAGRRISPHRERSSSSRPAPALLHQPASSSSNLSAGSQLSTTSTAPSSLFSARSIDEEQRPHLPPISAAGFKPSGSSSLADYSLRKGSTPDSHMSPALSHGHPAPPPFGPAGTSLDTPPRAMMRNLTMQQAPGETRYPGHSHQSQYGPPGQQSRDHQQPMLPSIQSSSSASPLHPGGENRSQSQQVQERDRLALLLDATNADRESISRPSS